MFPENEERKMVFFSLKTDGGIAQGDQMYL
jgi:hypothetical protein